MIRRMPGRIVLFGATGYTGELTARAMVERGLDPVLVARNQARLNGVAASLGGAETAVADATPAGAERLTELLSPGDALVSTVGPFARHGQAALDAAIAGGATYIDSTGEHTFLRRVFGAESERARAAGVALLPAFGYDYVPGTLAAALALDDAGGDAVRVDIGYFVRSAHKPSSGTSASGARMMFEPAFGLRDGAVVGHRVASSGEYFEVDGRRRQAVLFGGSEPFTLARSYAQLREVTVYLGWMPLPPAPVQAASWAAYNAAKLPPVRAAMDAVVRRVVKGSSGGPDEAARARARTWVVARAYAEDGTELASATVEGPDPYGLTADLLAWAAEEAVAGRIQGDGALGPLDAFGHDGLVDGCAALGLSRR
jgi:short subunit dehydrogenase-like uncharacterized protein